MTTTLIASASVHTTAAACDYLTGRVGEGDTVVVLTVEDSDLADRDAGDAGNVARTRLPAPTVETRTGSGEPAAGILAVAAEVDADEVVLGATRGDPDAAGEAPGSTVRAVLSDAERPVVVLPSPAPRPS